MTKYVSKENLEQYDSILKSYLGSTLDNIILEKVSRLQLPVTAVRGETVTMDANKAYEITVGETLTLALTAAEDTTIVNEWQGTFDTSNTAPTVTWPANVIWAETPTVKANTHYEFNIRLSGGKYYGLVQEWNINTQEENV